LVDTLTKLPKKDQIVAGKFGRRKTEAYRVKKDDAEGRFPRFHIAKQNASSRLTKGEIGDQKENVKKRGGKREQGQCISAL